MTSPTGTAAGPEQQERNGGAAAGSWAGAGSAAGAGAAQGAVHGDGVGSVAGAVVGALARVVGVLVDVVWELTELLAAAAIGAVTGAAGAVAQVWVADRPRRQRVRHHRRRRWWARGGWRRVVVGAEIVAVFSALAAITALRVVAATGAVSAAGVRGARTGWMGRRPAARARTRDRRQRRWGEPSQPTHVRVEVVDEPDDVVQGDVICGHRDPDTGTTCSVVLPAGWPDPFCQQHTLAPPAADAGTHAPSDPDEVVVEVEVVHTETVNDTDSAADAGPGAASRTRRVDGRAETAADRRFFDLRDAGYRGWIDQDGYAVDASAVDGSAGSGLPPNVAGVPEESPQAPGRRPAAGPQEHDQEERMNDMSATVTATRGGDPVARVQAGGGKVSSTGIGGELAHVDDLDAEAATMSGVIEQAQVLAQTLQTWQRQLPDRAAAAIGTTKGITDAVAAVREAPSTSQLREALTALREEIKRGLQTGDRLAGGGVSGEVAGVIPR